MFKNNVIEAAVAIGMYFSMLLFNERGFISFLGIIFASIEFSNL